MTKSLLTLFAVIISNLFLTAQHTSGTIKYTELMKLDIDLGDQAEMLKDMIPSSQSTDMILNFQSTESSYSSIPSEQKPITSGQDGNTVMIDFQMPETNIYINTLLKEYLEEDEIFGKKFLITDELKPMKWKITGEQKKVMDYVCQKAIMQDGDKEVIAWFAPKIQAQMGPRGYHGLPGMILALEQDGGSLKIVASEVNFDDNLSIDKPTKGKKVKRAEFEKIHLEKMKEAGFSTNGDGNFIQIKVETDEGF